jgi:hypothetical protein
VSARTAATNGNATARAVPVLFLDLPVNRCCKLQKTTIENRTNNVQPSESSEPLGTKYLSVKLLSKFTSTCRKL